MVARLAGRAAPRWRLAAALGLWLCQRPFADAKSQGGPLRLSGTKPDSRWKYMSKFGYAIGTGSYKLRVKLTSPKGVSTDSNLSIEVHLDEDWDKVEGTSDVCERRKMAKQDREIVLRADREWSEWVTGTLRQTLRPHIWYFAINDCNLQLQNFTHRLKFELVATQEDGSHYSVEMRGMLLANMLNLLGFTAFMWVFTTRAMAFSKSAGCIHPVIWTLSAAMILQFIAQLFHTLHLWRYKYDGSGIKPLEVISEIMFMLSQVTQTSLLILIGLGYTLLQSKIGELDLMIPMCFMIGVVHTMLVGFGKIKDDASYKFHENEGVIGWMLLVLRLCLFAWFLWAVQSSAAEGGMALRRFLGQFQVAGSIYFLSYPMIFIVTQFFAPYLQHTVMSIGLMCMQMGSNLWLANLFLTRGDYFKVSTLSASDLPGGCKVGVVKEE